MSTDSYSDLKKSSVYFESTGRAIRKIEDLEISNQCLLNINISLEETIITQNREINLLKSRILDDSILNLNSEYPIDNIYSRVLFKLKQLIEDASNLLSYKNKYELQSFDSKNNSETIQHLE